MPLGPITPKNPRKRSLNLASSTGHHHPSPAFFGGDWWKASHDNAFQVLHALTALRLTWITACMEKAGLWLGGKHPLASCRILDVGCGGGLVAEPLARLGAQVWAIDPHEDAVASAKAHLRHHGADLSVTYEQASLEDLPPTPQHFHAVLALDVVEHVGCPQTFFSQLQLRLKPGGLMVGSTLNRTWWSYLLSIVVAEDLMEWIPRGTHDIQSFLWPQELESLCRQAQLGQAHVQGIGYDVWKKAWVFRDAADLAYFFCVAQKGVEIFRPGGC